MAKIAEFGIDTGTYELNSFGHAVPVHWEPIEGHWHDLIATQGLASPLNWAVGGKDGEIEGLLLELLSPFMVIRFKPGVTAIAAIIIADIVPVYPIWWGQDIGHQ